MVIRKGYGQDQLLLGATVFGSDDKAAALFLGMWDYRPSFANRFFLSAQGMAGHYPKNRASTSLFQQDTIRAGCNDSDMDGYVENNGYNNWSDFQLEFVFPRGSSQSESNDYGNLFEDWKYDGGFGIRSIFSDAVVRFNVGFSEESQPDGSCSGIRFKGSRLTA